MNQRLKVLLIAVGVLVVVIIAVVIIFVVSSSSSSQPQANAPYSATEPITLTYWRSFDDQDAMDGIIAAYEKIHPNVTIQYKKFRFDEYESELLNALAEDRGPDIFSVHNTWVGEYRSKLAPMPASLAVQRVETKKKGLGEALVGTLETVSGYTPEYIRQTFVPAVAEDVIFPDNSGKEQIYGLPLYVDTLGLFYNPYLFNSAGIPQPPTNWNEFQDDVKKLTVIAPDTHEILQSGAAYGTSRNIDRAFDILSALMEQNGTVMSKDGAVTFQDISPYVKGAMINPAAEALRFYTDFAWVTKADVYTWNADQPSSVEAFSQERAAMMFGYSYHIPQIQAKAPGLRFEIAPLPQKQSDFKKTYANYWVEGVSNKSKYQDMAWDFIMFATSAENVKSYLDTTKHPTALRSLIDEQLKDDQIQPFASQLLWATNWYHGANPAAGEKAFLDMIDTALTQKGGDIDQERNTMEEIVRRAQQTISQTY